MTVDDLTSMTTSSTRYPWERNGKVMLPLASREVGLQLLCDLTTKLPTIGMADALRDLLDVGPQRWNEIAALLLADAQDACINVDLGFPVVEGEDNTLTNRREIGLNPDGTAPEGWASRNWIERVQVKSDTFKGDTASIGFKVEWELEHGCHIRLQDGLFETFHP